MSMELHVLFAGKLPSKAALTRCFKELGFPLTFQPGTGTLEQHEGYLPMRLRGEESGVEFDTWNDRKGVEEVAGEAVDPRFTRSANFRWGSDDNELVVALCLAAALGRLVDGLVFDPQEGGLQTVDQAIDDARKHVAATRPESKVRGTRPADIKHYLKPLLQMRSDLVLVGRHLLVRPVRHILRGALFDRTSDKYSFRLWRYVMPLYAGHPNGAGYDDYIRDGALRVWQPHFGPLLMDVLANDVFAELGEVTTLSEFATLFPREGPKPSLVAAHRARVTSFVLAGEPARAAEYVEREDQQARARGFSGNREIREHFERIVKDIDATCAECHAREAEIIKAMKLEHIWEPAPFPVESMASRSAGTIAEPAFPTTPWPSRPAGLCDTMPQAPGEIRYAKGVLYRDDYYLLLATLTPGEAEERHHALEEYVLAVRLADGQLLQVMYRTSWDRHAPKEPPYLAEPRPPDIRVCLDGISSGIYATIAPFGTRADSVVVDAIGAYEASGGSWNCRLYVDEGRKRIRDERAEETTVTDATLTPIERDLAIFPRPAFGECMIFVERIRSLLRTAGYGDARG